MGRPRSENPRTEQVMVRITEGQWNILDAIVSLPQEEWESLGLDPSLWAKTSTPTRLASLIVREAINAADQDPQVIALIQIRNEWQATHGSPE